MKDLFSALARWLENPTIKISPSDELVRLRQEIQRLTAEAERLTNELHRVERLYYDECTVNMNLTADNDALKRQIKTLQEEEAQAAVEAFREFRKRK